MVENMNNFHELRTHERLMRNEIRSQYRYINCVNIEQLELHTYLSVLEVLYPVELNGLQGNIVYGIRWYRKARDSNHKNKIKLSLRLVIVSHKTSDLRIFNLLTKSPIYHKQFFTKKKCHGLIRKVVLRNCTKKKKQGTGKSVSLF